MMDTKLKTLQKWRVIAMRCLIAVIVLSAVLWIGARLMLQRQNAADRTYYTALARRTLEPGNPQPQLPDHDTGSRKIDYLALSFYGQMGLIGACMATTFTSMFFRFQTNRLMAALDRPADPAAGQRVATYKATGDVLVSKPKIKRDTYLRFALILAGAAIGIIVAFSKNGHAQANPVNHRFSASLFAGLVPLGLMIFFIVYIYARGRNRELHIDSAKSIVRFFNFTFTAKFTGNKAEPLVELPFSEILVVKTETVKGRTTMGIRTTRGRVDIGDQFEHFDELVPLFSDIAEANRRDVVAYGDALKREPVIRIPWYGWLPVILMVIVVYVIFQYVTRN